MIDKYFTLACTAINRLEGRWNFRILCTPSRFELHVGFFLYCQWLSYSCVSSGLKYRWYCTTWLFWSATNFSCVCYSDHSALWMLSMLSRRHESCELHMYSSGMTWIGPSRILEFEFFTFLYILDFFFVWCKEYQAWLAWHLVTLLEMFSNIYSWIAQWWIVENAWSC